MNILLSSLMWGCVVAVVVAADVSVAVVNLRNKYA